MSRVQDTRRALLCEPWFKSTLKTQLPFAHCHITSPPKQHLNHLSTNPRRQTRWSDAPSFAQLLVVPCCLYHRSFGRPPWLPCRCENPSTCRSRVVSSSAPPATLVFSNHLRCFYFRMALTLPPSPHVSNIMANRRMPLADLQNATNSPLRSNVIGGKRSRASEQRDGPFGQPPPKKHIIEVQDEESRRHGLVRRSGAPATALTRKLEAARENKVPPRQVQRTQNDLDTIRQWQKHYKRLFPQFIFYFDSVSSLQKDKLMSRAQILGSVCRVIPSTALLF